jgi:hypothetical protein
VLAETVGTKKCPRCGEIKPFSSFNKDKRKKDGLRASCKICQELSNKKYRQNNRDKILQRKQEYRQNNRSKLSQYAKKYYQDNHGRVLQHSKKYYQNNRDKVAQRKQKYYQDNRDEILQRTQEYLQNNPGKRRALRARRRAAKRNATPPWADKAAINAIYAEALWLQEFTGEPYHVDHIVPLKSDFVCGLHVPANLQALLGAENLAKSNRSWPGQLPCQTRRGIDHQWWKELKARIDCGEEK